MAALTPAAPQAAELTDSPNLTRRAPMQPHEHQLPSSVDVSAQPQPMLMINSKAISSQKQNTNKKSTSKRIGILYHQNRLPSTTTPNPNLGASAAAASPNLQLDLRSINKSDNNDNHQPAVASIPLLIPSLNAYHKNKGMGFGSAQDTLKVQTRFRGRPDERNAKVNKVKASIEIVNDDLTPLM